MKKKKESAFGWILNQAKDSKRKYVLSVFFALLGVACQLLPYFIMADMVTKLMTNVKNVNVYLIECLLMLLAWTGRVLFHSVSTAISHKATFKTLGDIRKQGCEKLARMPLGDVKSRPSGTLKNILIERIDSIETTLAHIVPEFTTNLLAPLCLLICLFVIDWRMALISLITVPIGLLCYMGMMIGYEPNFKRAITATKNLNDTAVEYINGIQVIKVFGRAESSFKRFVEAAKEQAASYVDWMRQNNKFFTFAMNITPASLVSVLPLGTLLVKNGSLAEIDFVVCIILSLALIQPLLVCMSYTDDIRTMGTVVTEIQSILEAPELERPQTLAKENTPNNTSLKLNDVHFSYDEKEVLHGIDFEIPQGSYVALVGPSGSGKTTIANLIAGYWDVSHGTIMLGGIDIHKIPNTTYSDYIAFVSQDNYLFNMSIKDNIRIGKTTGAPATDEEVIEVAKKSGCHDFIMSLENGYDTMVGSSGGHLSGGERQRISIARAMLKDAPIVILDEATAYTDPESEAVIQQSVAKLVQGKTLIVIAHRLSTIKDADKIFVIHNGEIIEEGSHMELIAHKGLYTDMWNSHISVKDSLEEGVCHA